MTVRISNLLQGPGELYIAPFGTAEPATIDTAFATPWVNLGATQEGLTLKVETSVTPLVVDQVLEEVGATVSGRKITIATSLAEATIDNFARVLNEPLPAAAADGEREFTPTSDVTAFFPEYAALCFVGRAPDGFERRVFLRRTLSTDGVETSAKKDAQTVLPAVWGVYYVSTVIPSFRMVDGVAA